MRKITLVFLTIALSFSTLKAQVTLGRLWGMTVNGGDSANGVIYNYDTATSTETYVKSFAPAGGTQPFLGRLVLAPDGFLYGLAASGGTNGMGTIYKYNPITGAYGTLANFNLTNGSQPQGQLLLANDNNFYGTTNSGGKFNGGTIFEYNTTTNTLNTLYSFTNNENPYCTLIQATDGNLYGQALSGGKFGVGVLFEWDMTLNQYDTLHSFGNGSADGQEGYGSLMQATDGNIYGMTYGGGTSGNGIIFEWNSTSKTESTVYSFTGSATDGANPRGQLIQSTSDGNFYGMTWGGGANGQGIIFQYNPTTLAVTDLNDFANGESPWNSLLQGADGNFYGMTSGGGTNGFGLLFQYNPLTTAYAELVDFNGVNGNYPYGDLVQDASGNLYGFTEQGGAGGLGNIFTYTKTTGTFTNLLNLASTAIGYNPFGDLIQARDGNMYGMTNSGGTFGEGSIIKYNVISGLTTNLASFNDTNGANPFGGLLQCANGNFYGTTNQGGAYGEGTIFKYDTGKHKIDTLASFLGASNGSTPYCKLITGKDGNLYGTTESGGRYSFGLIFKYDTTAHMLDTLASFDKTNGADPYGDLLQATDGNFYGMATSSADKDGVVYECTPAGKLTALFQFTGNAGADSGAKPHGSLIQGRDSSLYGLTYSSGKLGDGTIFKYNLKTKVYTVLHDFGVGNDGYTSYGSLIQASNGMLYGVTSAGGANYDGMIFECSPSGKYTKLHDFTGSDGDIPKYGRLVEQMSDPGIDSTWSCAGTRLIAKIRGPQSPYKFKWSTGETTDTINVAKAGTYSFTVTDARGIVMNSSVVVNYSALKLSLHGNIITTPLCAGLVDTLTANATGTGLVGYSWSEGSTSDTANIAASGVYTVTITNAKTCKDTMSQRVTIHALPTVSVIAIPANATVCAGMSVTLSGNGTDSYSWSGGLTNGSAFVPTGTGGTYTVTGTNSVTTCSNTATKVVVVNALPTVSVIATPTNATVCAGMSVTLSGNGTDSYSWSGGLTDGSAFVPTGTGGTYTVTGTNSLTTCSNTATEVVTVNALPTVSVIATPASATVCAGMSVTLSGNGTDSYSWSGGLTDGSAFVPTGAGGTYTVTGTNSVTTCSNTATQVVVVNALPTVSVVATPTNATVCAGMSVTLSGNGTADSYSWSGGLTDGSAFIPTGAPVTYTVTGTNTITTCSNTATQVVTVNALPNVALNMGAPLTAECTGGPVVTLTGGTPTGGVYNGTDVTAGQFNPAVTNTYIISYIYTDGNGCIDSSHQNIDVSVCTGVASVNGSTELTIYPNPTNGHFNISFGGNVYQSLTIYDETGKEVVKQTINQNKDAMQLDMSMYANGVYYLRLVSANGVVNRKIVIQK